MHWTERRKARANLGLALRARGWMLYGFHEDQSDSLTDYYSPASWDGVAEKDGYVVVVDISAGSSLLKRSSGWSTTKQVRGDDCAHCGGNGKEPDGWTLGEARANPREFNRSWAQGAPLLPDVVSPLLFDGDGDQKCTRCNGLGYGWKVEEATVDWPRFGSNPTGKLWHVEQDGRILDSGVGLGPCADWDRERAAAAVERIVDRIEAAVARNEGQTAATTTHSQAAAGDVTLRRNPERQGIEVVFPAKPGEEVRAALKRLGFRWSRRQGLWYARFSASLWGRVHDLLAVGDEEEPAPGLDREPLEAIETFSPALDRAEPTLTTPSSDHPVTPSSVDAPPWVMSRRAYQESRALCAGGVPILNARDGREHESTVRQAVAEGLPVPAHVLAEYGLVDDVPTFRQTPSAALEPLQLALFAPS